MTEWPKPFDIKNDIFMPNKATTFRRQLRAALETRGLLAALEELPATLFDVQAANPNASSQEVIAAVDKATNIRQRQLTTAAQHLPNMLLGTSLTLIEEQNVARWAELDDAAALYRFIMEHTDIDSPGKVQDRLQAKYTTISVKETDDITVVSKQLDLKWWLFKHHRLYDSSTWAGQRQGLRDVLEMLTKGPPMVQYEATTQLVNLEAMLQPPGGGDAWIAARLQMYDRYSKQLSSNGGHLGYMGGQGGAQGGGRQLRSFENSCDDPNPCFLNFCKGSKNTGGKCKASEEYDQSNDMPFTKKIIDACIAYKKANPAFTSWSASHARRHARATFAARSPSVRWIASLAVADGVCSAASVSGKAKATIASFAPSTTPRLRCATQ